MYAPDHSYSFRLDTTSRKELCPHCGKKTFVLYLDADGNPVSPDVGRCDRKDHCGWHYPPKEYFSDRGLTVGGRYVPRATRMIPAVPTAPDYISPDIFEKTMRRGQAHSLAVYLHGVFDCVMNAHRVDDVLTSMGIGTAKQFGGSPVYWQIDGGGNIRTGKVMGYSRASGKRVKEPQPQFVWVHRLIKDKPRYRLQQCYFGSHALSDADGQGSPVIALFESEKAATVVALALSAMGAEGLWCPMACGGCEAFNPTPERMRDPYDALAVLRGRRVVLFPDEGKFEQWAAKGARLAGFASEVYVSTVMERGLHPRRVYCDIEPGDALDDLILRYVEGGGDVAELLLTSYGFRGRGRVV